MGERGGTTRKRGHQYHPQQMGQRRSNIPSSEVISALHGEQFSHSIQVTSHSTLPETSTDNDETSPNYLVNVPLNETNVDNRIDGSAQQLDESASFNYKPETIFDDDVSAKPSKLSKLSTRTKSSKSSDRRRANVLQNVQNIPKDDRQPTDGIADDKFEIENDPEAAEWSKLRCTSERTEDVAEREHRRQRRCADYPGLAFGRSIFSSDTMMKFNIIRNELHNIMKTQLKRAESEVAALNRRIQLLEEDLERSEERLGSATAKLSEASQAADESERIRKALENRTNMEDDRVAILEAQLSQAKLIAEEADKKYEEVARKLVLLEQDLERSEEKVELSESKIVELEEELRVVGNNLKSLEVSEEKASVNRETAEENIISLKKQVASAEARAEFAERSVQKLQKEVDRLEDEFIKERERYAEIGDDLDFAFVELIPGVTPCYNDRHPKPPTPKLPTPPALPTPPPEVATVAGGEVGAAPGVAADGSAIIVDGVATGESGAATAVVPEPEVPKGPPPPPPPFDYFLDLPAEGAEVPFVKNYVPPPEPTAIREDGQPTCNFISSFASHHVGVASDCPAPVTEASAVPAAATTEAPSVEGAPAATEGAPAEGAAPTTEAAPVEAAPVTSEAAPAEAAPAATS
ncbi:tropomyosin-1, isoforms 33/34 isoform X4 [Bradysia coprophila]|uniref:tropomyosin-1, isoforms 33/34 isoform X4 n=1 Tax=Bradysia coprophila TaxID=38358 RepID=UPI00187D8481|nr:tropomyosin-1, isoforms 33/34 isoform X4 [Bradysia coprophila]